MPKTSTRSQLLHAIVKDLNKFDTAEWLQEVQHMGEDEVGEIEKSFRTARKRLETLGKELKEIFVGKDDIIDLLCICAIAQEPMLIFGKPGTAKSELVVKFAEGLGVRRFDQPGNGGDDHRIKTCFEYLLNQYTEPDELLGPVVVKKLTEEPPQFERFREGMMPDAYIVFLDEIFRGNSAILNTLLSLINERRVYEAGTALKANTIILYGAANRPPVTEELLAFYERFPIRVVSELVPLKETDKRLELLRKGWSLESQKLRAGYDPARYKLDQVACLTDLLLCNRAVMELWGGPDFKKRGDTRRFAQAYAEVVVSLNRDKRQLCLIDDRKYVKLYKIIRAKSLYERMGPPEIDDLDILKHTWTDFDSREPLAELVESIIQNRKKENQE